MNDQPDPITARSMLATALFLIVAIAVLAFAVESHAAPCVRAHDVKTGGRAPCSGVLHADAEAIAGERCLLADLPKARKLRTADRKLATAAAAFAAYQIKACSSELQTCRARKPAIVLRDRARPWYLSAWLWAPVAAVAGAAAGYKLARLTPTK